MSDPELRIAKVFGFGESDNGMWLVVECEDKSGQRFTLRIPHTLEAQFFGKLQGAAGYAAKARGGEASEAIMNALNPEQVDIGVTDDGKIGLRMKLSSGSTLDLVLGDQAIEQFEGALRNLRQYREAGGSDRAQ